MVGICWRKLGWLRRMKSPSWYAAHAEINDLCSVNDDHASVPLAHKFVFTTRHDKSSGNPDTECCWSCRHDGVKRLTEQNAIECPFIAEQTMICPEHIIRFILDNTICQRQIYHPVLGAFVSETSGLSHKTSAFRQTGIFTMPTIPLAEGGLNLQKHWFGERPKVWQMKYQHNKKREKYSPLCYLKLNSGNHIGGAASY